ncbi:amino acid transporter AVT1H [Rhodamnia argentea]|uniref:Amino acid transporter AVT1H n=1 Tax=Rhodamnia argentea TaxID=178133 RepID=A0A8B8PQS0_9MYRT|nr:amino acid transporter AVT1H [Rhodamnia argentea]
MTILQAVRMKLWMSIESCLSRGSQIASESVQGAKLAVPAPPWIGCESCAEEENRACWCERGGGTAELKPRAGEEKNAGGANSSFAHAVINMVGMLVGLGQLSTPYALENGGWSSAFLFIGLGIICAYTSHLLGKCLEKSPKSRSYTDIGQEAYGSKGKIVAATFIYLEIFMALVSYTISLHDNLSIVFSGARIGAQWAPMSSSQLLTVIAVLIALPSLWLRDLSAISFLSSGGILMSLIIFASVVLTAVLGGVRLDHEIPALQIRNIPGISGLYVFSYAGHIVFPDLYKSMKDPSKFTKVSIVSFTLVTALYTALAFMGAKMFGPGISSQITLSLPRDFMVTKVALWATVLTPMTKYALEFAPFAIQLDRCLVRWSMSTSTRMAVRGTVASVLLLVILSLALSVPYFEYVLGLTGSLVSICICVILPCGFYTKICWPSLSKPLLVLNVMLIGSGCVLGVFGTISSSRSLIKSLQGHHSA